MGPLARGEGLRSFTGRDTPAIFCQRRPQGTPQQQFDKMATADLYRDLLNLDSGITFVRSQFLNFGGVGSYSCIVFSVMFRNGLYRRPEPYYLSRSKGVPLGWHENRVT